MPLRQVGTCDRCSAESEDVSQWNVLEQQFIAEGQVQRFRYALCVSCSTAFGLYMVGGGE